MLFRSMRISGVTITAAMLAAAIRIEAGLEGDVRAVIIADDGLGEIAQELGPGRGVVLRIPIQVPFEGDFLEAVGRVAGGAPAARR